MITNKFYSSTHRGQSELCGKVFKIEYSEKRQRLAYIRLYSGVLHLRDSVRVSEKEKIKVTEMYTSIMVNYVRLIELILEKLLFCKMSF